MYIYIRICIHICINIHIDESPAYRYSMECSQTWARAVADNCTTPSLSHLPKYDSFDMWNYTFDENQGSVWAHSMCFRAVLCVVGLIWSPRWHNTKPVSPASIRPSMEKSHTKRHDLLFCWILSGLVQQKQGNLKWLYVKRGVGGVASAICAFLGGMAHLVCEMNGVWNEWCVKWRCWWDPGLIVSSCNVL